MSCTNCKPTLPIPAWTNELTICKIADVNKTVFVHIIDVTVNSRIEVYETTSDSDGNVILDVSDRMFPENHSFEITVCNDASGTDTIDMIIDSTSYSCLMAQFKKLRDGSGDIESVTSYSIQMA